ncbi:MAG: response regulator [Burkholderiales bacterium]|nr:response regulator [Burkholderiales bacterium]
MTLAADILRKIRRLVRSTDRNADIEQAWLRVSICALGFVYVCVLIWNEGMTAGLAMGLAASSGNALIGLGAIAWLRRDRKHVVALRYLSIVSDNTALTLGMAGAGEAGVAMVGVYLWVTIGNGFRFGPRYLLASYWLSILGFGLQMLFVPFWEQHRSIGVGLMIAGAILPLYVLVLINRLTAQKDAAEQLSNAKSRFVANVSHELRTPLTGVFAVYDLLHGRKMAADDRELVAMLGNAVKALKTSVDAVLQMSKLEAGAEREERRLFNLWYFVQQLGAIVRPQSVAKGVRWSLHIDPGVPPSVVGDPTHLSHVLGNLLNNAFKFTAAGGVTLRVVPARPSHVRFEVVDTGIGIPLDQQERLFERFVQVDNSATRSFGGTGLGTSIARDLTELMGGRIGVVSAPGQGSTFSVELPLARAEDVVQPSDWDAWQHVLILGEAGAARDALVASVTALGLGAVISESMPETADLDANRYLAAFALMPASDAALIAESLLRDAAGATCPLLVAAENYSPLQHASLVAAGVAGLLPANPSLELLRETLAALLHRLELPTSADVRAVPDSGMLRSLTILLADDNPSNQLLLSRILEDAGHKVRTADCGGRAFDLMAAGDLDLALLDLNMPDMSGPDVIKLFRAGSIGGPKLPIVILSADATPAAKQESIEAGADEFVTKPVTASTLLATIERVVAGASTRTDRLPRPPRETRSEASASPTLVDAERIAALRRIARGDARFLDQYIAAAFSELEAAISELRVAVSRANARAARDAMHIIEGTGASIGAAALVANCKSMRSYLAVPNDPDCAGALAELSTTYALTKSTVQAMLHDRRGRMLRSNSPG